MILSQTLSQGGCCSSRMSSVCWERSRGAASREGLLWKWVSCRCWGCSWLSSFSRSDTSCTWLTDSRLLFRRQMFLLGFILTTRNLSKRVAKTQARTVLTRRERAQMVMRETVRQRFSPTPMQSRSRLAWRWAWRKLQLSRPRRVFRKDTNGSLCPLTLDSSEQAVPTLPRQAEEWLWYALNDAFRAENASRLDWSKLYTAQQQLYIEEYQELHTLWQEACLLWKLFLVSCCTGTHVWLPQLNEIVWVLLLNTQQLGGQSLGSQTQKSQEGAQLGLGAQDWLLSERKLSCQRLSTGLSSLTEVSPQRRTLEPRMYSSTRASCLAKAAVSQVLRSRYLGCPGERYSRKLAQLLVISPIWFNSASTPRLRCNFPSFSHRHTGRSAFTWLLNTLGYLAKLTLLPRRWSEARQVSYTAPDTAQSPPTTSNMATATRLNRIQRAWKSLLILLLVVVPALQVNTITLTAKEKHATKALTTKSPVAAETNWACPSTFWRRPCRVTFSCQTSVQRDWLAALALSRAVCMAEEERAESTWPRETLRLAVRSATIRASLRTSLSRAQRRVSLLLAGPRQFYRKQLYCLVYTPLWLIKAGLGFRIKVFLCLLQISRLSAFRASPSVVTQFWEEVLAEIVSTLVLSSQEILTNWAWRVSSPWKPWEEVCPWRVVSTAEASWHCISQTKGGTLWLQTAPEMLTPRVRRLKASRATTGQMSSPFCTGFFLQSLLRQRQRGLKPRVTKAMPQRSPRKTRMASTSQGENCCRQWLSREDMSWEEKYCRTGLAVRSGEEGRNQRRWEAEKVELGGEAQWVLLHRDVAASWFSWGRAGRSSIREPVSTNPTQRHLY